VSRTQSLPLARGSSASQQRPAPTSKPPFHLHLSVDTLQAGELACHGSSGPSPGGGGTTEPGGLLVKEVITQTNGDLGVTAKRTSGQLKAQVANIENIETAVNIYRSALVLTLTYLNTLDGVLTRPPTHEEASKVFNRVRTGLFDELGITDYFRAREEGEKLGRVHDHVVGLSNRDVNFAEGWDWLKWDLYKAHMKRTRFKPSKLAQQLYEQAVPRGTPMRKVHDALKRAARQQGRRYEGLGRWMCEPVRPGKEGNLAGYLANYISKAQAHPMADGKKRRPRCYSYGRTFPRAKLLPFAWDTAGSRAFKLQKAMLADALGISSNFKAGMRTIFGKRWGKRMIDVATKLVIPPPVVSALLTRWDEGQHSDKAKYYVRMLEHGIELEGGGIVNGVPYEDWNQAVISSALEQRQRAPIDQYSAA